MREKLLSTTSPLRKLWMLLVMMLATASSFAQVDWPQLPLRVATNEANIFDATIPSAYQFTPEKSGVLTIWSQDVVLHVYSALNAEGNDVNYETQVSNFANGSSYTEQDVTFSKKTVSNVEAGKTYYVVSGKGFSKTNKFLALMEGDVTELKLIDITQPEGKMFNITDERDGQVELEFNLPATADQWAYLKVGNYPLEPENGKVETRPDPNTGKLVFKLKDLLTQWMEAGHYTSDDNVTLSISGICAKSNSGIKYGTDGKMTLTWKAPVKPHMNTKITAPNPFLSYWLPGDQKGILVLEFDYPLMTKENGQTARVSMNMGSADMGDAWQGELPAEKISVDGNKLYVDFTGIRRTYEDLGLVNKWTSINIKVNYILMEDGTMCFNPNAGNYGSVALTCTFQEYKSDLAFEFTPANDATLTKNYFKVYFSDKTAYTFKGVRYSYQDLQDNKWQEDVTEGITSVEEGDNGIEYTIPVPEKVKNGKNIRISFLDALANDGMDHTFSIRYNPGPELVGDLVPVKASLADNSVVTSFKGIALTFDEKVNINELDGNVATFYDKSANYKETQAEMTVSEDGKTVTFNADLVDTHQYEFYVNYYAIVNDEYIQTEGKYGRYIPGYTLNFTVASQYNNYEFAADPVVGATVRELSVISCTTKPGADSYTQAISNKHDDESYQHVEDEKGVKVTDCTLEDIPDGFAIKLAEPITKTGTYTVVLGPNTYVAGEGHGQQPNETEVRMTYTVKAPAQPVIEVVSSDPASESKVESISEIIIEFSENVNAEADAQVMLVNKTNYQTFYGELAVSPKMPTKAIVMFDEPITAEGTYTLILPEGIVGDDEWYQSYGETGKINVQTNLYFTIGGSTPGGDNAWTTDPADGSTVSSLHEIHVWNNTVTDMVGGSGKIVVKKDGVELEKIADTSWGTDLNELIISTSKEYTEDGVYTFEVPEGFFLDGSGNSLPAVTFTYTIGNGGGDEPATSDWRTDPADGSTVTSIKKIHVWNNTVTDMVGGSGKIVVKKDGVELEKIADTSWGTDLNELIISTSKEYTEDGVYTFEVPEGFFLDGSGNSLPAVTFTYIISTGTGIDGIAADAENAKVYSVDGIAVKNADRRGLYIINGKKVVTKK